MDRESERESRLESKRGKLLLAHIHGHQPQDLSDCTTREQALVFHLGHRV